MRVNYTIKTKLGQTTDEGTVDFERDKRDFYRMMESALHTNHVVTLVKADGNK